MRFRPIPPSSARGSRYSLQVYHFHVFRLARCSQRWRLLSSISAAENRERFRRKRIRSRIFFARRGKTRRSINSETNERWDAGFCTGWIAVRGDGKTARVRRGREGEEKREERRGCRGWPRRPTGKGWNRGRTINLTIYPLRRGRGAQSEEEARKRWSASCRPNKRQLWVTDRQNDFFYVAIIYRRISVIDVWVITRKSSSIQIVFSFT